MYNTTKKFARNTHIAAWFTYKNDEITECLSNEI